MTTATNPGELEIGAESPFAHDAGALEVVRALRQRCPKADPLARLPDVHPARIPRHIAIIMDGNGRWAQQRGFPRLFGHRNGANVVVLAPKQGDSPFNSQMALQGGSGGPMVQ